MRKFVINLKRRPDRLASFFENMPINMRDKWEVIEAVDGMTLEMNANILRLFNDYIHRWKAAEIACSLSHMSIYEKIIDENIPISLIAEDDMEFIGDNPDITGIVDLLNARGDWDVCMLGYTLNKDFDEEGFNLISTERIYKVQDVNECCNKTIGGMFCMLVRFTGAVRLLEYIVNHGIQLPIDSTIICISNQLDVYYATPVLAYSPCYNYEHSVDTDIQNCPRVFNLSLDDKINLLLRHYEGKRIGFDGNDDPTDYDVFISKEWMEGAYKIDSIYILELY